MPTSSKSSMVRLRDSLLSILRCSSSASEICRLIVRTGFKLVMGSWKIIAMLFPRIPRTSSSSILRTSSPSKMIAPLTIFPGGCGMRRISESAVTDLPHPDSPTMPSVSPWSSSNDTPSTARTTPSRVKNCVCRSVTARSCANAPPPEVARSLATLELHARVEGIAQPVAHEGKRQQDDGNAECRQQDRPWRRREHDESIEDHGSPRRGGRADADAQERKRRLGEHRAGNREGDRDDDRREDIREEMLDHDPDRGGPDAARGLDEFAVLEREDLTAHEPRESDPTHDSDADEDQDEPTQDLTETCVAKRPDNDDHEQQVREGVNDVGEAH